MTARQQHVTPDPVQPDRFVRRSELLKRLAVGNDKLELMISTGAFPEPIRMGTRTMVWLESEVQAFLTRMAKDRRLPNSSRA
jgi:predicted DNA-binding transcriptional regulator AlpA